MDTEKGFPFTGSSSPRRCAHYKKINIRSKYENFSLRTKSNNYFILPKIGVNDLIFQRQRLNRNNAIKKSSYMLKLSKKYFFFSMYVNTRNVDILG